MQGLPDLSDLVPFHSGLLILLVLGQVKINLQFGNYFELIYDVCIGNSVDSDQLFLKEFIQHSDGFTQLFVHYLFRNMQQVKLSMDKYLLAIYLSLGKYKLLPFPHPW